MTVDRQLVDRLNALWNELKEAKASGNYKVVETLTRDVENTLKEIRLQREVEDILGSQYW